MVRMAHRTLAAAFVLLFLPVVGGACPGQSGRLVLDSGRDGRGRDRPSGEPTSPRLDQTDPGLCAAFASEGQSCATQACPQGLIPAVLDGKACTCHVPCNPAQGQRCQPEACGRICVQLTDGGQPLPGQGACIEDKGSAAGEPCPPACRIGLSCILHGEVSFCRRSCTGSSDCPGFKMVCVPLSSASDQICLPGGSTVGPQLGESCAAAGSYCVLGLLCDPQSQSCVKACAPASGCPAPATCSRLLDPASGVVIGYGCR